MLLDLERVPGFDKSLAERPQLDAAEAALAALGNPWGERLARWCFELQNHAASERKKLTREDNWDSDWTFIKGNQWTGPLPSYRRPIVMNAWKRALHVALAIVTGNRPILKLIPQGASADPAV